MDHRRIKSLEVSDFRGLQGKRTLNFESADIILFLGLNGFGKTSVFDAIEWCLTGKLSRYEQYTETGRRQDFGREKQVLRNKYATNPNTFVKVILENGDTFGRRVLSNNSESDYNMGSIIDGCEYGLGTIAKEVIKPELANSYFSATHILSQETIHHFVTSKKPEERYQALSVNFGTAIFTPFDSNIQILLSKIADCERDLKQELDSKFELISTLKSQIGSRAEEISNDLKEANELIEIINNLNTDIFHKPLAFKNSLVSIDVNFEEYVSNSRSRANLDYSGVKERLVGLRFLEENIDTWKKDNKELNNIELSISRDKESIAELDLIYKAIRIAKSDISALQEKLKPISVRRSNIQNAIKNLPHFIEVSLKTSEIEAAMQKRNNTLSVAHEKSQHLEKILEDKKQEITGLDAKLRALQSLLIDMEKSQQFFSNYQSEQDEIAEKISKAKDALESLKDKSNQYRSILMALESLNKPSSIKSIIDNPGYRSLLQSELADTLIKTLNNINAVNVELEKNREEEKHLSDEESKIRSRFSETRKLLSNALTQIDQRQDKHLCPICDTSHETQSLVRHIETKLGIEESDILKDIHARLSNVYKNQADGQERFTELDRQFKDILDSLNSSLTANLTTALSEKSLLISNIENLIAYKGEIEKKYEQLTYNIDRVFESKPRKYSLVIFKLVVSIKKLTKNLEDSKSAENEAQKNYLENESLLRSNLQLNQSNLSEIVSLKDTKYTDVHQFLVSNGINSELSQLEENVINLLSQVDEDEKFINEAIKAQENLLTQETDKQKSILKEQTDENFRKEILKREEQLSKIRESLSRFLIQLSKLEISPTDYIVENILNAKKEAEEELIKQESKINTLDKILAFVAVFKKFNSNNKSREKVEQLEREVESLNDRKSNLRMVKENINRLRRKYPSVLKELIKENLDENLFNRIYELLNPHRRFKKIDFNVNVSHNRIGINFNAKHSTITARPEFLFSSAQLNTFGICMFLSMALRQNWLDLDTILIDDPIQNLDDINILSFIDFLRSLLDANTATARKQIVLSTHDERFYDLMLRKFQGYNIKSFKFESYGKLAPDLLNDAIA